MDYTDLATVKKEILSGGNMVISSQYDDLLTRLITAVSRDIDEYCSQKKAPASINYFMSEVIVDEVITGLSEPRCGIVCWPHKPNVVSVSSYAVRLNPRNNWSVVSADDVAKNVELDGDTVYLWDVSPDERCQIKISYVGGFGATVAALPASLVEAATVLSARYFKEASTGLGDSIGVVETGIISYVKAMPVRVKMSLDRLQRVVPW
jgi:hypothetical protein